MRPPQQGDMEQRRLSFDAFAAHYDDIRPGYPPVVMTDIANYCGLSADSRILEIGAGTGQATAIFARNGYSLTALEPSRAMAAIAQRNLRRYPGASILEQTFEDAALPVGGLDLIFAAQAFHWVDTIAGFRKAHRALCEQGVLAVFWNLNRPLRSPLQDAFKELYGRYFRGEPWFCMDVDRLERSHRKRQERIEASGLFSVALKRDYNWSRRITGEDYVRLLDSYSDHRLMPEHRKRGLYSGILAAVDNHGGSMDLPYVTVSYLCTRRRIRPAAVNDRA